MTEGGKRCGLGSLLPMACRGRAEAFARRLHSRLRSLGSQDEDTCASESSWLASNELSNSVTSLQPRHSATDADIFMDFGMFDTPGSPEVETADPELATFITNPKDDLHHNNLDECDCMTRNSIDSDSSDGQYYDPENTGLEVNHVNGISAVCESESAMDSIENGVCNIGDEKCLTSDLPSSSDCTVSSLSRTVSDVDDENFDDSLSTTVLHDQFKSFAPATSGWSLSYKPKNNSNNNVFSAIDFESLKPATNCTSNNSKVDTKPLEESCNNKPKIESYGSRFNIKQDFTVECPGDISSTDVKEQVSTLEIEDKNDKDFTVECPGDISCTDVIEQVSTLEIEDKNDTEDVTTISDASVSVTSASDETASADVPASDVPGSDVSNHLTVKSLIDDDISDNDLEEERIPRVRRCSSLKTGKTPPGTPGRKKIVRFADVLGLDLADVRTFMDEIPKIPISAYDDLSGADLTRSSSNTSISSTSSPLESLHTSAKTLVPLFQQPGGEGSFLDKIRNNHVCLENAVVQDSIALCVCGTVRVRNLDFHKSVHVRYTMDAWKNFADMQATYLENSCDGFSDKFSFTLYVHTLNVGQRLEFALRFQCKGCQYWDNNAGENYCFQCLPVNTNTSYLPIATPNDVNTWEGAAFYYTDMYKITKGLKFLQIFLRNRDFKSREWHSPKCWGHEGNAKISVSEIKANKVAYLRTDTHTASRLLPPVTHTNLISSAFAVVSFLLFCFTSILMKISNCKHC